MTIPGERHDGRPATALEAFLELVRDDRELRGRLRESTAPGGFVGRLVSAGRERGFAFEAADVEAAILAGRRRWFERRVVG